MCVALFIVGVVTGPQHLLLMWISGMGGLYLGVTMNYRFHHLPLLLLGITCGAVTLYLIILLLFPIIGLPLTDTISSLHQAYNTGIALVNLIAAKVGLGNWWKQNIYSTVASLAALGFTYWWVFLYLALWAFLCPIVTAIYTVTNLFVRLLGYEVRPFPDGWLGRSLSRITRRLVRIAIKRGRAKRGRAKREREKREREPAEQKEQAKQEASV
jgi:hypothetical protein